MAGKNNYNNEHLMSLYQTLKDNDMFKRKGLSYDQFERDMQGRGYNTQIWKLLRDNGAEVSSHPWEFRKWAGVDDFDNTLWRKNAAKKAQRLVQSANALQQRNAGIGKYIDGQSGKAVFNTNVNIGKKKKSNVVVDKATGKAYTQGGEEFNANDKSSMQDAEHLQELYDKQQHVYNEAVDNGMIADPMDVDAGLSDAEVKRRMMERRKAYATREMNKRGDEIDTQYAGMPQQFNSHTEPTMQAQGYKSSDQEYQLWKTAKQKSEDTMQMLDQQIREERQKKEDGDSWLSQTGSAISNFGRGIWDAVTDYRSWEPGITEMQEANTMLDAKRHMENGSIKEGSDEDIATQVMLTSLRDYDDQQRYQAANGSKAYSNGAMTGISLTLLPQFLITGGSSTLTKGGAKLLTKMGIKEAEKGFQKYAVKAMGRVLSDAARATVLTGALQGGKTYAAIMDDYLGVTNEKGATTYDENGKLKFNEDKSLSRSIYDAGTQQFVENFSELMGEWLPGGEQMAQGLRHIGLSKVANMFAHIGSNGVYQALSHADRYTGVSGIFGEIMEEEFGIALNSMLNNGGSQWSDFIDGDKQFDLVSGLFFSVGAMNAPRYIAGAYSGAQYMRYKHYTDNADKEAQNVLGDRWDSIRDVIDGTTNDDMTKVARSYLSQKDKFTSAERNAISKYALNLSRMRGYNTALTANTAQEAEEAKNDPEKQEEMLRGQERNASYMAGANATADQYRGIQLEYEQAHKKLSESMGIEGSELEQMSEDDILDKLQDDDQLDMADDFLKKKAAHNGMQDAANQMVEDAKQQATAEVDKMTNQKKGIIQSATLKSIDEEEDKDVYVVGGNLVTFSDGTIDHENSDKMIVIYNPEPKERETISPSRLLQVTEERTAQEVKDEAAETAVQKVQASNENDISGKVATGSVYSVIDETGATHTIEVGETNQDGTVNATYDGQPMVSTLEALQQERDMSDAALTQVQSSAEAQSLTKQTDDESGLQGEEAVADEVKDFVDNIEFDRMIDEDGSIIPVDVEKPEQGHTYYKTGQTGQGNSARYNIAEFDANMNYVGTHRMTATDVVLNDPISVDEKKEQLRSSAVSEYLQSINEHQQERQAAENNDAEDINDNVEEPQQEQRESDEGATDNVAESKEDTSALSRIPVDEKTQEPLFEQVDSETALQGLNELTGNNTNSVAAIVNAQVQQANKALETLKGKKPKKATPKLQGSPMEMLKAQQQAEAKYESDMEKYNAQVDAAEQKVKVWNNIASAMLQEQESKRKEKEAETNEVENANASNEGATVKSSAKKRRALETAYVSQKEEHHPTVVSSADGAKVLKNIDNLVKNYENVSNQVKTFIGDVAKALGAERKGSKSEYATFETKNGKIVTIRLADHNAKVSNFDNRNELDGISIVISPKANEGIINNGDAHVTEFFYDARKLRKADGKPLVDILNSIKQTLYSGEFKDETGLAERQEVNGVDTNVLDNNTDSEVLDKVEEGHEGVTDWFMPKAMRKDIEKIAKKLGYNVQWLYTNDKSNGFFVGNTVYLSLDAERPYQFVFGHEMTHAIKSQHPQLYKRLMDAAKAMYADDEEFQKRVEDTTELYRSRMGGYFTTDAEGNKVEDMDAYTEEVVADTMGEAIFNAGLMRDIAFNLDHPTLAAIRDAITSLLQHLTGKNLKNAVDSLSVITDVYNQAYEEHKQGKSSEKTKESNKENGQDIDEYKNGDSAPSEETDNAQMLDVRTMSEADKQKRGNMLVDADVTDVSVGQIKKSDNKSARNSALEWWKNNIGESCQYNTEIGKVVIDEHSIEDSLAHGYNQAKLDAITSLDKGFENAVYLGSMPDFTRQEGVFNHYFTYPINYDGKRSYVFCRAMQDTNKNRLYVHEVFVAGNIQKEDNTLQTAAFQPHGGIALYKSILSNVLSAANVANNSDTTNNSAENLQTSEGVKGLSTAVTEGNSDIKDASGEVVAQTDADIEQAEADMKGEGGTFFNSANDAEILMEAEKENIPQTFDDFLASDGMKYSIRNEQERQAAENAYDFAKENRPDSYHQYAVLDMSKPGLLPQYYMKQQLADKWRRYANKLQWGNYKMFDLDKPFEENVAKLKGAFPEQYAKYSLKDDSKADRIEKLRESNPIEINGDEITPSEDLKEYKKNALEYGKSLRGIYTNEDTGEKINLTSGNKRGGIREILQHDYKDIEHLQSIAAIPQIIQKAIFIDELPNEDKTHYPDVKSFRYYVCGLKIGDKDYTVKAVVAEQNNGNRYYDHRLTNIEKGKLLSIIPTIQKAGIDGNQPNSAYKDKRLISILQTNLTESPKYSLRETKFKHELAEWKKQNALPKTAKEPQVPIRDINETDAEWKQRLAEYRKEAALWKTAPTYEADLVVGDDAEAIYNRALQRKSIQARIVIQDGMLAIREAQNAISREVGSKIGTQEDAYNAENRSHGKAKNEMEEYNHFYLEPLRKAYNALKNQMGGYGYVKNYLMAKHGLERNAYMAFMAAAKEQVKTEIDDIKKQHAKIDAKIAADKTLSAADKQQQRADNKQQEKDEIDKVQSARERLTDYQNDISRIMNDADYRAGKIDFEKYRQRDNSIRIQYAPMYLNHRYDKMGIPRDFSGLSALFGNETKRDFELEAGDYVTETENKHGGYTDDLWDAIHAATNKTLFDSYRAGMMTKKQYQSVHEMFQDYIPLRGWNETTADEVWDYVQGSNGGMSSILQAMHGRESIADDPIAYIEQMAQSAIIINNKNDVKQRLLLLARNHPTSLLTLSKAWYIKTTDAQGNEKWIPASPNIPSDVKASKEVQQYIDQFEQNMELLEKTGDATQKKDGLHIEYPQTTGQEREHEIRVMDRGQEYVIYVNGDPALAQAINGTRSEKVREDSGLIDKATAKVGRFLSQVYTSFSPMFIPTNYFRDLTMVSASTAVREDRHYNALLYKNFLQNWGIHKLVAAYSNGSLKQKIDNGTATKNEEDFYNYMMNGGETGYVTSVTVDEFKTKIMSELGKMDEHKLNPKKLWRAYGEAVEFLNRGVEASNRYLVYKTSIEYGRSVEEAINDAKNVTLNFNRKGTGEHGVQVIRNLYLFINPAIQSLQTLGALAKDHPGKLSTVAMVWIASGALVPAFNQAMLSAFGDDDDKDKYWRMAKWDRRNNAILYIPFSKEIFGETNFVKIPLAQEFRAFYGLGDMLASIVSDSELSKQTGKEYASDIMGQILDLLPLDPTGYGGQPLLALMPDALRWPFALAMNTDFTGKPISKESEYNQYMPTYTKAYKGTPDWLVQTSRTINAIGNDFPDEHQNGIDRTGLINPAKADYVLKTLLGGSYTFLSKGAGVATKMLREGSGAISTADVPLWSSFVINPNNRPQSQKQGDGFWDMADQCARVESEIGTIRKEAEATNDFDKLKRYVHSADYREYLDNKDKVDAYQEQKKIEKLVAKGQGDTYKPHKTTADDIYNKHRTIDDIYEDMKLDILWKKLNAYETKFNALGGWSKDSGRTFHRDHPEEFTALRMAKIHKELLSTMKKLMYINGKDKSTEPKMKRVRKQRQVLLQELEAATKNIKAPE